MKRILIFKLDEIAYNSTRVFADVLGDCLKNLGAKVEFFDAKKRSMEELEDLTIEHFDALIDFNSKLPGYIKDEKGYLLDYFNAPFYNYIVDHPIYHHNMLQKDINNYNVICIDDDHAEYIKKYYQNIKHVYVAPIGAVKSNQNYSDEISEDTKEYYDIKLTKFIRRKYDVIFPGTYLCPEDYYEIICNLPDLMRNNILNVAQLLLADPDLNYEDACLKVLKDNVKNITAAVQSCYLADIYVRARIRQLVLDEVVKSGKNITVFGEKYNLSNVAGCRNVTILPAKSYIETVDIMRQSKYVLNVMPLFRSGIHDRVLNAMINGAVSITDGSKMMHRYFIPGNDYIEYSVNAPDDIAQIIASITEKPELSLEIALSGCKKSQTLTFAVIAKKILDDL